MGGGAPRMPFRCHVVRAYQITVRSRDLPGQSHEVAVERDPAGRSRFRTFSPPLQPLFIRPP